jgi:archaellum biogenesis ATPase FlaH
VVVRLADEPTCKLALHYRELGDDMRKVIATKDAAHTREKYRW